MDSEMSASPPSKSLDTITGSEDEAMSESIESSKPSSRSKRPRDDITNGSTVPFPIYQPTKRTAVVVDDKIISNLTSNIKDLSDKIATKDKEIETLSSSLASSISQLAYCNETKNAIEGELRKLRSEKIKIEAELAVRIAQIEKSDKAVVESDATISKLNRDNKGLLAEIEQLDKTIKENEAKIFLFYSNKQEIEKQRDTLVLEKQALQEQIVQLQNSKTADEASITALTQQTQLQQKQIELLQQELQKYNFVEDQKNELLQQNKQLSQQIKQRNQLMDSNVAEYNSNLMLLKEQISLAEKKIRNLEETIATIAALEQKSLEVQQTNELLQKQIAAHQQEITELQSSLANSREQLMNALNELDKCEKNNIALRSACDQSIATLKGLLEQRNTENAQLAAQKAQVETKLYAAEEEISILNPRVEALQNTLKEGSIAPRLLEENGTLRNQLLSATEERASLQLSLDNIKRKEAIINGEIVGLQEEIRTLKAQNLRLLQEKKKITDSLGLCTAQVGRQKYSLAINEKTIQQEKETIIRLTDQVATLSDTLAKTEAILTAKESVPDKSAEEIDNLKKQIGMLQTSITERSQLIDTLTENLSTAKATCEQNKKVDMQDAVAKLNTCEQDKKVAVNDAKVMRTKATELEGYVRQSQQELSKCNKDLTAANAKKPIIINTTVQPKPKTDWLLLFFTIIAASLSSWALFKTYNDMKNLQASLFIQKDELFCYSKVAEYNRNVLIAYIVIVISFLLIAIIIVLNPGSFKTYLFLLTIILTALGFAIYYSNQSYNLINSQTCSLYKTTLQQELVNIQLIISVSLLIYTSLTFFAILYSLLSSALTRRIRV